MTNLVHSVNNIFGSILPHFLGIGKAVAAVSYEISVYERVLTPNKFCECILEHVQSDQKVTVQ
jgi:hypothetical protein